MRSATSSKKQYIQITEAELARLEAETNSNIELREFMSIEKVDPVYFDAAYYLAPEQGGEKAYRLLADPGADRKLFCDNFEPEAYENKRCNRVLAMIDEKVRVGEVTVALPSPAPRVVIDLMATLKESMRTAQRGKRRIQDGKRKKA
jgi:non-homologous end joining protein Ku